MKGLRDFLHDGVRVRTELIAHIVHKLQKLIDIVSQQNCLRFYSSSLLIMYEGHQDQEGAEMKSDDREQCCVDIQMIDFANTCHKGQKKGTNTPIHNGPDKGYMYGLENLVTMLNNLTSKSERLKDASCSSSSGTTVAAGVWDEYLLVRSPGGHSNTSVVHMHDQKIAKEGVLLTLNATLNFKKKGPF